MRKKIEKAIAEDELNVPVHNVSAEEVAEIREREHREKQREDAIHECLAFIPDDRRDVIVLHRFEKLKYRDIADTLGIPMGTVKSRMSRGKEDLVHCLRLRFPDLF